MTQASAGALEGVRILELGAVPPTELPGMLLSDMGAEVLKIDTPGTGDAPGDEQQRAAAYVYTNRNKRSITLNLKMPEGREIFGRLANSADVVIEGFRPGVVKRLGADYDTLSATNPRIVYCSLSGFGQDGPYRDYPAHDLNFIALAGVLGLIGEPGRKPAIPLNLVADYAGASMHAALGIMLALFARERSGRGQYMDISYLETTIALLAATPNLRHLFSHGKVPPRGASTPGGSYPYYAIYETRDGKLITIACSESRLWEKFCKVIGREDFIPFSMRPEHRMRAANAREAAVKDEIEGVMKTRDRDEWQDLLVKADVCVGKVYEVDEMLRDPQVVHRKVVAEIQHPKFGPIRQFASPLRLAGTPPRIRSAAPFPGEHTEDVLGELGFGPRDIAGLRERRVL